MAHVLMRHRVEDYLAWKQAFDGFIETRRDGGERSWQLFHPENEPNNIVLLFEWDSLENARAFLARPELHEAMKNGGVTEIPDAYFMEEYDSGTV